MNLREVVKRFGKDVGINLRAVRTYATQMFSALTLMQKCNVMHADLVNHAIFIPFVLEMTLIFDRISISIPILYRSLETGQHLGQ